MSEGSYFILLCSAKRQKAYDEILSNCSHDVQVVDTPDQALQACVREPPAAVVVDMVTGMRAGTNNTSLLVLYNLELTWPVVRSTAKKNEPVTIISTSPQNTAPFLDALDGIATADSSWVKPLTPRRFIRQAVQCRARTRPIGQENWDHATVLEISTGGCFMVSYTPYPIDSKCEVEVWDIAGEIQTLDARVVWIRSWTDGPQLPGMGLAFNLDAVSKELTEALGESIV